MLACSTHTASPEAGHSPSAVWGGLAGKHTWIRNKQTHQLTATAASGPLSLPCVLPWVLVYAAVSWPGGRTAILGTLWAPLLGIFGSQES